jgi:hypothetical protein
MSTEPSCDFHPGIGDVVSELEFLACGQSFARELGIFQARVTDEQPRIVVAKMAGGQPSLFLLLPNDFTLPLLTERRLGTILSVTERDR